MKKIKIGEIEYKVKRTMRSMMMFEQIMEKPVSAITERIEDIMCFYFCILKASNKEQMADMDFDGFVDLIDEHDGIFEQLAEALNEPAEKKA